MRKCNLKEALERFGDMMNDNPSSMPTESLMAAVIEFGPAGAAIRNGYGSRILAPNQIYDPIALNILECIIQISIKSRNALFARYVRRDLRTGKDKAELCDCKETTYKTRLQRGEKEINRLRNRSICI